MLAAWSTVASRCWARRAAVPRPRLARRAADVSLATRRATGTGRAAPAAPAAVPAVPVAPDAVPYALVDAGTLRVIVPVGDACTAADTPEVAVTETATRVVLRASVRVATGPRSRAAARAAVLRTLPLTVSLDAPVGARTVLDGVGRRVVPPGAWPG